MDDHGVNVSLVEELLDQLDRDLSEMSELMTHNAHEALAERAIGINGVIERLVGAVRQLEPAPENFTPRYRQLLTKANVVMVGCFWRSMVVANLMRDLGLDIGLYRGDGDLELLRPESVSHRA
ncbi:MAG: hypothetical protein ACYCWN_07975 [Ferrimicrobium sp.]|uniref:Uncharacterized protein n=1 Tax=Ferrimicrobium acidiphilum TaxID=121039 RepID=A0ABV3Y1U2_9ACTN|nr:hypothetical protein [Ferrimicrobium sp.]